MISFGTCLLRTLNRSNNGGDSCPESFRTHNLLGKNPLPTDHKPEKALEVDPVNRANRSPFDPGVEKASADRGVIGPLSLESKHNECK